MAKQDNHVITSSISESVILRLAVLSVVVLKEDNSSQGEVGVEVEEDQGIVVGVQGTQEGARLSLEESEVHGQAQAIVECSGYLNL